MKVTLEAFSERYRYEDPKDLIGKGGFSEVYKAWDKEDEQFVALKIATVITSEKYSLASEVKKIKKLRHPNLIEYYEIYEVSTGTKDIHGNALNYQVAVMEYADGGTLADLLKIRPLTSDEAHDLAEGIINGLDYLHENNIIHRDLKPANILLTNTDGKRIPKITDFGIAKNVTVDNTASTLLVGTVEYMAPEYFRQDETQITTSAADVWSLGVILLEIVTGTHPFGKTSTGKTSEQIIYSIISADLTSILQNLHTPLKELITRCLIQDPDKRPQSAAQLKELLQQGGDIFSEKTQVIDFKKKHEESERKKKEIEIAKKIAEAKSKRKWLYVVAALLFLILLPVGAYLGYQKYYHDKPTITDSGNEVKGAIILDKNVVDTIVAPIVFHPPPTNGHPISTHPSPIPNEDIFSTMPGVSHTSVPKPTILSIDPYDIAGNMVLVKGGTFTMGRSTKAPDSYCYMQDETPSHSVTLSSFSISKYEVTQAKWQAIMGSNPSHYSGCDNCPVENVSWNFIQEFIYQLNLQTGQHYRLPTEAEWEYAARGGNKSRGYKYSGSNDVDSVAWFEDNSKDKTHKVDQKQANELGLYAMTGNVSEWCSDYYEHTYYYSCGQLSTNPNGPNSGKCHVVRGSSWGDPAECCHVANRSFADADYHYGNYGFRLALD